MNRRFSAVALAALVLGVFAQAAAAQTGARITLRHLQTEAFPIIAGTFAARDATGAPITGLQADAVQALEDGAARPLAQLREVETGVRIIVVLNPAEPFAIRDAQARTRFEYVKEALLGWAGRLPSNSNMPLTLITPDGVAVQDEDADGWAAALEMLPTVFGGFEVSNEALLRALELAAEPPAEPDMATAIWWITATPRAEVLAGIPDWQAALVERGIPLFVWQIDSPSNFESEAAVLLQDFAAATGGASFAFSSGEVFPEPEDYFTPLRQAYYFQYDSQLHTAGSHDITLALQSEASSAQSQPISFELDILPPNPILVSPPTQIDRGPSTENPQQLSPFSQPIEIIVEFPDEFQRDLIRTTLYVNDERVAENRTSPFTRFAWDLSEFTVSEQVLLRVEAQDELGLVGSSIEFPVQVRVENPQPWYQVLLARGGPALAVMGVLFAAGALFLILVLSGRLQPRNRSEARRRRREKQLAQQTIDPLSDSPLDLGATALEAEPTPISAVQAPAYLQRLNMQSAGQSTLLLSLESDDISIGSDAANQLVIEEESVDGKHARISRMDDGSFLVSDLNSGSGTWINYAPVSAEGGQLRDGDLLHVGRVAFRFLLNTRPEQ